jgi:Zn2+/Cd2+-exporting ATPase
MTKNTTVKYRIKNLDCASCAVRIEEALIKNNEVKQISVDPVHSVIETNIRDIEKLNRLVKEVEPDAVIEEIVRKVPEPETGFMDKELFRILIVIFIMLVTFIFRYDLRETFFPFADNILFFAAYLISGWNVIKKAIKNILRGKFFDETFLMSIATIGAIIINEIPEAVTVMLFYNIGEYVQGLAVSRSKRSIKSLLSIRPDYANRVSGDKIEKIPPEDVNTGDLIIIRPGERVPLDGIVFKGSSYADTFALTGESVPRSFKEGDEILSGMVNKNNLITVKVTRNFSDSSFTRIIDLVENASKRKAETEKFITRFAYYYTPVVVSLAAMVAFLPPLLFAGEVLSDWVYRALVMLVVSCPCALVISIPLGYFGGIGGASRKGILIKGSVFLDALTEIKTIVFDKTGTLTKGVFNVTDVMLTGKFSKEELLKFTAHAEAHSNHPVASSIIRAYDGEINHSLISSHNEIAGMGVIAVVDNKKIIAGNDSLLLKEKISFNKTNVEGTLVHIAIDNSYAGYFIISDELKERAAATLQSLNDRGIKNIMLTGDNETTAKNVAGKLHLDNYYSGLLPEDKLNLLEKIMDQNKGGKTAFVGDGINDAPVIARSDVGFAMGGLGSDAAVEASDIVIMEDDPSKVLEAINIAVKTRSIVWQNILFALGVKVLFIALGALGIATMWEAVFGDMGVAIIAIINSTRAIRT